jgi:minor extracellular serine protease Vpr
VLYLTGLGAVSDEPTTGTASSLTSLSSTLITPQVTIAGAIAPLAFSGLAPGFIGLYQINVTVPQAAPTGLLDIVVQSNGVISNTAKVAVQ